VFEEVNHGPGGQGVEEIGRLPQACSKGAGIQDVLNGRRILALDQSFGGGRMLNNHKGSAFGIDDRMRLPARGGPNPHWPGAESANNQAGCAYAFNVLYLSCQNSGDPSDVHTGRPHLPCPVCRARDPQKVQVQMMTGSDTGISAWCDYLRTEKWWVAVIPERKPAGPPWDACLIPIDLEAYSFSKKRPSGNHGRAGP